MENKHQLYVQFLNDCDVSWDYAIENLGDCVYDAKIDYLIDVYERSSILCDDPDEGIRFKIRQLVIESIIDYLSEDYDAEDN